MKHAYKAELSYSYHQESISPFCLSILNMMLHQSCMIYILHSALEITLKLKSLSWWGHF